MAIPDPVEDAVEAQLEALRKVAPRHRDLILDAYKEAEKNATKALKRLPPKSFTAQKQRQILVGARTVVAGLERALGDALKQIGIEGSAIGKGGLLNQINAWRGHFTGTTRRINPVERTEALLDRGLLEFYGVSRKVYGDAAIKRMRRAMVLASAEGLTVAQSIDRVAAAAKIPRWKAERIARTESSFAAHRIQVEDMTRSDEGENWVKELVAVFDTRTGADSKRVDGQQRPIDKVFIDPGGELTPFLHPPNRPNDRETMVMVPSDDEPEPGTARLDSLIDDILAGRSIEGKPIPPSREPSGE